MLNRNQSLNNFVTKWVTDFIDSLAQVVAEPWDKVYFLWSTEEDSCRLMHPPCRWFCSPEYAAGAAYHNQPSVAGGGFPSMALASQQALIIPCGASFRTYGPDIMPARLLYFPCHASCHVSWAAEVA